MAGVGEKGRNWARVPAVLVTMAVSAALLTPMGPAGASTGPAAARASEGAAITLRAARPGGDPAPAARPIKAPSAPAAKPAKVSPAPAEEKPFGPVPESEAAADDYFAGAVFLGDSRTEGFHLYSGLKAGTYLYSVGATVESVFTKRSWPAEAPEAERVPLLDALKDLECGKVYLMLGINELGWSKTENFHDQYAKVVDRIREDHPEAEIVLQTILPVSARQDAKGSYVNNERIRVYNEVIRTLAEEKDCALVDVAEVLTGEDGCLPADLNFDGVHLNPAGCRIWLEYLRTHTVKD